MEFLANSFNITAQEFCKIMLLYFVDGASRYDSC